MNNSLYYFAALILILILYIYFKNKGIPSITTQELKDLLSKKGNDYIFVDVRTAGEFNARKIKKFRNIPLNQLSGRLSQLPQDKTIVLICQSGSRSTAATRILLKANYPNVLNVRGGMNLWR